MSLGYKGVKEGSAALVTLLWACVCSPSVLFKFPLFKITLQEVGCYVKQHAGLDGPLVWSSRTLLTYSLKEIGSVPTQSRHSLAGEGQSGSHLVCSLVSVRDRMSKGMGLWTDPAGLFLRSLKHPPSTRCANVAFSACFCFPMLLEGISRVI